MTAEYLDSKRIIGLSYSPASTDIADSAWTVTCSNYAASSGVINWTGVRSAGVDGIHYDVGAGNISDTQWVLRFKMTTDAASGPSSGSNILHIAVSDAVVQPQSTGSEDSLGYYERYHSGLAHKQTVGYGDEANLLNSVSDFNTTEPSTGAKYIEFKRTSATSFTVTRYSDEFVTTMETAKTVTIASTIQSLRYVKIQNKQESPASTAGTFNGTVTKVQFWNNTTSATGTPTWSSGAGSPDKDSLTNVQEGSILVEKDTANRFWGSNKVTTEEVYAYTTTQSTNEKLSGTAQAYSAERAGVELVSTHAGKYIKVGKWNLKRVGTLGSNAFMKVEDSSGTVKGTSTGVAASGIGTSAYEDVTFTLPTAVELANGDRVYVEYTGTDGSGNYLAFGEKHPSTTPTGWEFTIYNKHNSSGASPSGTWGDDGLPTALVPVATFDSAPASDATSDSITWTQET